MLSLDFARDDKQYDFEEILYERESALTANRDLKNLFLYPIMGGGARGRQNM